MENIIKKLEELREDFVKHKDLLDIERKLVEEKELRLLMADPNFWQDRDKAVKIARRAESLFSEVKSYLQLGKDIRNIEEMAALAQKEQDSSLNVEIEKQYKQLLKKFNDLEFKSLFSAKYDYSNAIISIHAGTGGIDAQDWAQMLERMYFRFCERQAFKSEILDRNYGHEAGIKSVVFRVVGPWAYAYLKSENGVHRLLRNSPFDADGARHTSFSLVEVMPEIKDEGGIVIKDKDLRVDVFRSSGPGGQGVNTSDSAVRLVHLPSGISVACQTERSQHQNKENALKILKAKLYKLALEKKDKTERILKGDLQKAEWGRQIRSYFLYANKLIKDHRTNYETSRVEDVLDGDLRPFMEAYLRYLKK